MDEDILKGLKHKLVEEKETLESDLAKFAEKNKKAGDFETKFPNYGRSEEDNESEIITYTTLKNIEEAIETRLQEIKEALLRIAKKTYGRCIKCKKEIEIEKLNTNPTTLVCRECQLKSKK
ncbi:MAG TPA: TraR/DksA C4-type zinc finger protein [Candidatus Paceibacterota bacterium]|nr:TraR/DksA C4-type zinc finger protein [Candidatus Paceibacterota bacterium]